MIFFKLRTGAFKNRDSALKSRESSTEEKSLIEVLETVCTVEHAVVTKPEINFRTHARSDIFSTFGVLKNKTMFTITKITRQHESRIPLFVGMLRRFWGIGSLCFLLLSAAHAQENESKLNLRLPVLPEMERKREIKMTLDLPADRWESSRYPLLSTMNLSDYLNVTSYPVDQKLRLLLYNSRELSPGMSDVYKAGGAVQAHINESFLLQSGFYAMRYTHNFGHRPYYDGVSYLMASYQVNSWLTVGAYGRYSLGANYNAQHGSMLLSPFVPQTGYGVSATAMFNKIFGIYGTVCREFDPFEGKWKTVYDISPVIDLYKLFK